MAAVTAAVVEEFVRNLELSDLTHSIVKEKFRKHINKDSLTKEEKLQLKRAVEKALLESEAQEDESSDDDVPLSLTAELLRKQRRRNSAPHPTGEDDQTNDESPVSMEKAGSRGRSAVRRESPSPDRGDREEEEEEEVSNKPPPRTVEITPGRVGGCQPEGTGGSDSEGTLQGRSSGADRDSRTEGASSESDSMGVIDRGSGQPRHGKGPRPAPSQGQKPRGKCREDSEEEGEEEDSDSQASASGADEGQRAVAQSSADERSGGEGSPSSRGHGRAPKGGSDSSNSSSESDGDRAKVSHNKAKKHNKRKLNEKETRKEEHPTIKRLKRCITACGVHRNYKKLFANCHSNKAKIRVLRQELEDLGIKGNPSLEKCKALRFKRDEEAELASLDVANIIHSEGRPRRQRAAAWDLGTSRPQSYKRTLPSDSEDEERPRKLTTWSNLQGLISDDCESD